MRLKWNVNLVWKQCLFCRRLVKRFAVVWSGFLTSDGFGCLFPTRWYFVMLCFGANGSAECLCFFKTIHSFKAIFVCFLRISFSKFDTFRLFCFYLDIFKISSSGNSNILCHLEKSHLAWASQHRLVHIPPTERKQTRWGFRMGENENARGGYFVFEWRNSLIYLEIHFAFLLKAKISLIPLSHSRCSDGARTKQPLV